MGCMVRHRIEEAAKKLIADKINSSDIFIVVSGGVACVEKSNLSANILILDVDNLEDSDSFGTSKELTRDIVLDEGISNG